MSFLLQLSPGLAFLGLALGMAWVFRTWFEALPWRVLALGLALVLLRFAPELFAGRTPLPLQLVADTWPFAGSVRTEGGGNSVQSDLLFEVTPLRQLVAEEFGAGRWPLWNARFGTGMPLLGNPQSQVFEPTALASIPWVAPLNLGLTASLRLFLAYVFVFVLGRRLGLGTVASTFGAVSYGFGGYLALWLGWPLAAVAVWTPGLLYGLLLLLDRGRGRDLALTSLCAAALLVSGHPETILYTTLGCSAFVFWKLRRATNKVSATGRLLIALAIALGLASPTLLAVAEYLPQTFRQELLARRNQRLEAGLPIQGGTGAWRASAVASARQVLPVLSPRAFGSDREGTFLGAPIGDRPGSGFPGTLALSLALSGWAARGRRQSAEVFFFIVAVLALLLVAKPPGLPTIFLRVPVLSSLPNQWSRVVLWFNLGTALSAAFSLDRWLRGGLLEVNRVAVGLPLLLFGGLALTGPTLGVAPRMLVVQALLAALTAVFLASPPSQRKAVWLLTLAALELGAWFGGDFSRMPRGQGLPVSELVAKLGARVNREAPFRIAAGGDVLPPNLASLAGLNDLRVSDPARPWASHELLRPLITDLRRVGDRFGSPEGPLLQALGVRYWVVPPGERLGPPWRRVHRSREGAIYEQSGFLPIVFLLRAEPPEDAPIPLALAPIGSETRDLPVLTVPSERWSLVTAGSGSGLLTTSVYDDGNWHVLADGLPAARIQIQGAFVGARIPGTARRVELLYRPRSVVLGFSFAALALSGLAVVLGRPRSDCC